MLSGEVSYHLNHVAVIQRSEVSGEYELVQYLVLMRGVAVAFARIVN